MEIVKETKEIMCGACAEDIEIGDEMVIDVNRLYFCSEKCLFEHYGQDYEEYVNREDKTENFIDMGLFDVYYIGRRYF